MLRIIIAAFFCLSLSVGLEADDVCITCENPAATYRCTFHPSVRDLRLKLGEEVNAHVCEKVLADKGPHGGCRMVTDAAAPCDGPVREVTLADYQGAMAGDTESTYEPGLVELARRQVYAAWLCVTSLFGDC